MRLFTLTAAAKTTKKFAKCSAPNAEPVSKSK
jgi:hypothetical protein